MVMIEDMDLGLKRPETIILKIVDKVLIVMVEVDIGLRPATLPHITQVNVLYCCFYM